MRLLSLAFLLSLAACASTAGPQVPIVSAAPLDTVPSAPPLPPTEDRIAPVADHHQHLLSPAAAAFLLGSTEGEQKVVMPAEVAMLLARRAAAWNNATALLALYAEDALLLDEGLASGRDAVAERVSQRFGRPYQITPLAYSDSGATRRVAALYTRGEGIERSTVGETMITLTKDRSGKWLIGSETMRFPGPANYRPLDADALVKLLDEAQIDRAVIMSVAYFFESPHRPLQPDSAQKLRAENDWTAAQVARHPTRLAGFCGINPLAAQALDEIRRCRQQLGLTGLKLHFGNSIVDLEKAEHLARMKQVFALANELAMPIAAHLWSGVKNYGAKDAEIFLAELAPAASDVVIQIMHMAGGGPGWTDSALEVFAKAVEAGDPRTRNFYFDVATVADLQTADQLKLLARRIRQIGPSRILYGSDAAFDGRGTPSKEWSNFRGSVPLTDAEFDVIKANVAPYLRN